MTGPVVSRQEWPALRGDVVVADVRRDLPGRPGAAAYAEGHLPGAVLVELDRWLAGPPTAEHGRHPLPGPEVFAEGLARAGIGDGDTLVAYDDEGGVIAARLVWMLRATGRDAALLDGGWRPEEDGRELAPAVRPRAVATARPWPAHLVAGVDEVAAGPAVLLDARPAARFAGAPDPLDPRPGHVPGARSVPAREAVDGQGLLLPADVLRRRLTDAGVEASARPVAYCGSGVTACHVLLVLEHVGLDPGRLSPGSWSQWAADPTRPAALGPG